MRPIIPTELPDFGFITDLNPDKDPRVFVIRTRAEKVLNTDSITTPFVEDLWTVYEYTVEWGSQHTFRVENTHDPARCAVDDIDRIKRLVHTAVTALSQAQVIIGFETDDDDTDWIQKYNSDLAKMLYAVAERAAFLAYDSARSSRKERVL